MNLLNMLEDTSKKTAKKPQVEEVSVLIGKAWVKADKNFSIAPLTVPVEGKQGEFETSPVYPLIVTDYCRITFGINKNCDASKNQNSHWAFLNVEKAKLPEYKELLGKIGQELGTDK